MKKHLILITVLLLALVASVAAVMNEDGSTPQAGENRVAVTTTANNYDDQEQQGQQEAVKVALAVQGSANNSEKGPVVQNQEGMLEQKGLSNALAQVQNEAARQVLEQNMQRFLEKYQARLENLSDDDISVDVDATTGQATVKATEPVKYFGFIQGKATTRFEIQNNGQVTEKQPWYRFMYKAE